LHNLGGDEHQIFVNAEQSEKERGDSELNQEAIHRAFRNKQRQSKLIYKIRRSEVTVLSGKSTHRLGVETVKGPDQQVVPVTSLTRTLIDITVRPAYAGGAVSVAQAFRAARGRFVATDLHTLLQQLDYIYPYHQAIGFYMKCAGYPRTEQQVFAANVKFDFYVSHGLKNPSYDKEWKIFIPKELETI
jgi:predicted transcriptional regulator of viral defense system